MLPKKVSVYVSVYVVAPSRMAVGNRQWAIHNIRDIAIFQQLVIMAILMILRMIISMAAV